MFNEPVSNLFHVHVLKYPNFHSKINQLRQPQPQQDFWGLNIRSKCLDLWASRLLSKQANAIFKSSSAAAPPSTLMWQCLFTCSSPSASKSGIPGHRLNTEVYLMNTESR